MADSLDLVFRRLVLSAQAADALARPIEIGEILDTFAPYRAARRDGQLDTHDDYLHAVLRLLAGERNLMFADDLMQDDLRNELASPNPELGILRTYANAKVRISSAAAQRVLAGDTGIDLRPPTPASTPTVGTAPSRAARALGPSESAAAAARAATTPEPAASPRVSHGTPVEPSTPECPYCAQVLPADRVVRFCPTCGINLRIRRCPGCSAEIESEWKFCVTCGRSAA